MNLRLLSVLPLMFGLSSCLIESNQPKPPTKVDLLGLAKEGPARYLNKATYDSLPAEQQYQVANKLLGTLYKGITVREFFDMSAGMTNPRAKGVDVIGNTMAAVLEPMDGKDFAEVSANVEKKYLRNLGDEDRAFAAPLAYMYGLPVSKELFSRWVAYQLVNNIMFSPAEELDSAFPIDVSTIFNRLVIAIEAGDSISEIIYNHMVSQENWRRFRSPEDNVREMAEIYLLRFKDDEVPRAAKACKNWHLTDDDLDYRLVIDANTNSEPVPDVLDTNSIVTCTDFYHRVSTHPALIPTVAARVVDQFFPDYSTEQRANLVNSIVASHPTRFDQVYASVIFSEEYLMRDPHIKYAEETLFNTAARLQWSPRENNNGYLSFYSLNRKDASLLSNTGQAAMRYKLGRLFKVPTDSLSFANYHKLTRDTMVNIREKPTDTNAGWASEIYGDPIVAEMSLDEYIRYLFLVSAQRQPSVGSENSIGSTEFDTIKSLCTTLRYTDTKNREIRKNIAILVFDYVSRLPETYAYNGR